MEERLKSDPARMPSIEFWRPPIIREKFLLILDSTGIAGVYMY